MANIIAPAENIKLAKGVVAKLTLYETFVSFF
jgi:hypothetical protein